MGTLMIAGLVPVLLPRQLPLGARTIYTIPELANHRTHDKDGKNNY
ncbi:hypothetical protein OG613_45540 (plasmid) [Streptomyces sp. NBC_00015]